VYPTVPHGVIVCSSQTIFDRPKSAILTFPMPPPPTPGINSPSSSLGSSFGPGGGGGFFEGTNGMGSNKRFSGLISLNYYIYILFF
jgi:hypothetical protein